MDKDLKRAIMFLVLSYSFDAILQTALGFYLTLEYLYIAHWLSLIFSFGLSVAVIRLANRKT